MTDLPPVPPRAVPPPPPNPAPLTAPRPPLPPPLPSQTPPPATAAVPHQPPAPQQSLDGDALVVAQSVSKWFGDLVAVSDVSFSLTAGVTALLGPNGAGKSTMLRMLCGLAAPSNGFVEIMGMNPRTHPEAAAEIGLAPQQEGVFETLTAQQFVELSATLQGLPDPAAAARAALEVVELEPADTRKLPTYSKGMRQRVKLAQAIVHEPRVIMLDEPLTGLDPRQRLHMVDLFHRLGDQGRCVIVSSHVLEEVERFGSNVLVIAKGRLAAQGDFRAIRALMDDRPLRIRVKTDRPRELAGALVTAGVASGVSMNDNDVEVDTLDAKTFATSIAGLAQAHGARLLEVRPLDDDLESVFRYLVDRR